jgi:hypothetical protein
VAGTGDMPLEQWILHHQQHPRERNGGRPPERVAARSNAGVPGSLTSR